MQACPKRINLGILKAIEIPLPSLVVQKRIARIIKSLDDKIQLNRQTNQTLEQIAQAIFKSWFVDFEPTRAKITARKQFLAENPHVTEAEIRAATDSERQNNHHAQGAASAESAGYAGAIACERAAMAVISGKSLQELDQLSQETDAQGNANTQNTHSVHGAGSVAEGRMPEATWQQLKATAALFPDALVESELGEIPEGWEVKSLSEIIEIIGGGTPKRSEGAYWNGDIPWFSVKDAPSPSDVFVVDTIEKISPLGLQKSSTKLLPIGTTIITARGTVGKLALVGTPMCMNQSCYGIRGIEGIGPYFNYLNLREAISTLQRNTHGAVFDTITAQTFESYSMAICIGELIQRFDEVVTPIFEKIELSGREIIALSKLRDTLLPKLLSGELAAKSNKENVV